MPERVSGLPWSFHTEGTERGTASWCTTLWIQCSSHVFTVCARLRHCSQLKTSVSSLGYDQRPWCDVHCQSTSTLYRCDLLFVAWKFHNTPNSDIFKGFLVLDSRLSDLYFWTLNSLLSTRCCGYSPWFMVYIFIISFTIVSVGYKVMFLYLCLRLF